MKYELVVDKGDGGKSEFFGNLTDVMRAYDIEAKRPNVIVASVYKHGGGEVRIAHSARGQ